MSRKRFPEVFVDLVLEGDVRDLLEDAQISRIAMTPDRTRMNVYLESERLIFRQQIAAVEEAIRSQISEAIEIMIHMSRMKDGSRKIVEIAEIVGFDGHDIVTNSLFIYEGDEKDGQLVNTGRRLQRREKIEMAGYVL